MYYGYGDKMCPMCGTTMLQTVQGFKCPDCLTEHIICNGTIGKKD